MTLANLPTRSPQPLPIPQRRMTFADYVAFERKSTVKHHLSFGRLLEVAGATYEHNIISANLVIGFGILLDGTDCRPLGSDQKIYISPDSGYYPDVVVTCGSPRLAFDDALQNPVLIAEILSPSTAAFDRGEKFRYYRTLPSLRHFLFLEQDTPYVEHYERDAENRWTLRGEYNHLEQSLVLTIGGKQITLPLSRIYRDITFPLAAADAETMTAINAAQEE